MQPIDGLEFVADMVGVTRVLLSETFVISVTSNLR